MPHQGILYCIRTLPQKKFQATKKVRFITFKIAFSCPFSHLAHISPFLFNTYRSYQDDMVDKTSLSRYLG